MSDIVLGLRLKADGSGLVGELKGVKGQITEFGNNTDQAGKKAQSASHHIDSTADSVSQLKKSVIGVGAAIAGAFAIRDVINFADSATLINNRLRDVSGSSEELASAQRDLLGVANDTRSAFTSSVDLYATLHRNARQLVDTDKELVGIVKTVNQSFALSGASMASANAAIVQLSQGLASGTLRGDEFNSVAEQAPEILRAVQKELGVSKGELREMAAEGKITAQTLISALQNSAAEIDRRFSKSSVTVEQSLTIARNNLIAFIGEQDEAFGASEKLSSAILMLGDNIEAITDLLVIAAAVTGGKYAGSLLAAAAAKATLIKQALIATPAVSAMNAAFGIQASRATASTIATNALAVSVRGLNTAMMLLGGPAGIAIAAGATMMYFANKQEDAAENTKELTDETQKLIEKFGQLNAQGRAIEIGKLTRQEATERAKLLKLQQDYNAELERQKQANANASPATNQFSGISSAVKDSQALGVIQVEIDKTNGKLTELATTKQALFDSTLNIDDINTPLSELNGAYERASSQRLDAAMKAYESEVDAFNRQQQLKQHVLKGSLTAEEAAIYDSMWRQEEAYAQQYDRLKLMVEEYYDKEIERAAGNAEIVAQLEQEKSDRLLDIKRTHQESERLIAEQFALEQDELNKSAWDKFLERLEKTAADYETIWMNAFDRFAAGMGDAVGTAVVEGENFGDAMKQIAKGAIKTVIAGLVEIGVQELILAGIRKTITTTGKTTNIAAATAEGAALTTAYSTPAALASLATGGSNSVPAMAGISSTFALTKGLSIVGQAHGGLSDNAREGTWWLRNDEMVLSPQQADNFNYLVDAADNMKSGRAGSMVYSPNIHIDAPNAVPGMEQRIRDEVERGQRETYMQFQQDFASGGPLSQSLNGVAG